MYSAMRWEGYGSKDCARTTSLLLRGSGSPVSQLLAGVIVVAAGGGSALFAEASQKDAHAQEREGL